VPVKGGQAVAWWETEGKAGEVLLCRLPLFFTPLSSQERRQKESYRWLDEGW